MSGEILCCVEGCNTNAEIEVERQGDILWICVDHYEPFFTPGTFQDELTEQKEVLLEIVSILKKANPETLKNDSRSIDEILFEVFKKYMEEKGHSDSKCSIKG